MFGSTRARGRYPSWQTALSTRSARRGAHAIGLRTASESGARTPPWRFGVPEGLLRRRRLADRRRGSGARQHWRQESGHRRVRCEEGEGDLDGPRRSRAISSAIRRDDRRRRYAVFLTRKRSFGARLGDGPSSSAAVAGEAGRIGQVATPLVSATESSCRQSTGQARRSCDWIRQLVDLWASDDVLSNHYATSVFYDGPCCTDSRPSGVRAEFPRRGAGGLARFVGGRNRFRSGSVTLSATDC